MELFIAENPGLIKYLMGVLIAITVYFYKRSELKSAKLISEQLKELASAIKSLVERDANKEKWMTTMQSQINARDAVCSERAELCGRRRADDR